MKRPDPSNKPTQVNRGSPLGLEQHSVAQEESLRRLQCLVDAADEGVAVIRNGRIDVVNPAMTAMLGYEGYEPIGASIEDHVTQEDRSVLRSRIAELSGKSFELRFVHADGSLLAVEARLKPIHYEGADAFVLTARNISDRKMIEEALRQSEEWYRTLLEGNFDGIYVQKGTEIVFASSRLYEMLGYGDGELEGMDHTTIYHPDYRRLIRTRALARMAGQRVPTRYGVVLMRKDGTFIDAEISARAITAGSEPGVQVCLRDVTDRKQAEQEMLESEWRFRVLFESTPDCVFLKDTSRRYTHVNPAMAELFRLRDIDIVGKTDADLFEARTASYLTETDTRVLRGEHYEAEHTRKIGGAAVTFHDIRIPLRDVEGKIVGLYGISRNVTGRRERDVAPSFRTAGRSNSPVMRSTLATARMAAEKEGIILLLGESGVGKDHLARFIHESSPRRDGPFFTVNCAALPSELVESELFGHERGAFTGATGRKRGLLELAEGGTLLLNEIGELPLQIQAKLLTFLDSKTLTRVGGESAIPVNARILAATNKNLESEAQSGRFRSDLYYRINVLAIRVPPLRERREDIPVLARSMLDRLVPEMQLPRGPEIEDDTLERLADYEWPGNVRELRNALERALMLWTGGPLEIHAGEHQTERDETVLSVSFPEGRSLFDVTDDVSRELCKEALRRTGGNKREAAELLGISRNSLYRLLTRLGISFGYGTK
jgi:PAS domain S-box-containing protein